MLAGYYKANICIYPDSIRLMKLLVNLYQVGTSGQWLRRLVCLSIYSSDHKMLELAVTQCGVVLSLAYSFHVTFMAGELFSHSSLLNHSKQICNPENHRTMSFHILYVRLDLDQDHYQLFTNICFADIPKKCYVSIVFHDGKS